jgi:hypothetical protein
MVPHVKIPPQLLALALAIFGLVSPLTAQAQDPPSYARPEAGSTEQTIRGRIQSVDGAFHLTVADDRGFVDSVQLHQGTIINPTGLTLAPGINVTITGYNADSTFNANEINAPYHYTGAYPAPVYYGPGWWYPGFGYGYGPAFNLGLVFVGGGYTYVHRPFYGQPYFWRRRFYGQPFYGQPFYGQPFYGQPFYGQPFYGRPYYGYGWHGGRAHAAPYGFHGGGFHGHGHR